MTAGSTFKILPNFLSDIDVSFVRVADGCDSRFGLGVTVVVTDGVEGRTIVAPLLGDKGNRIDSTWFS